MTAEPRTRAGRAFLDQLVEEWEAEYGNDRPDASARRRAADGASILAIEAEARRNERERIQKAADAMAVTDKGHVPVTSWISLFVLRAIVAGTHPIFATDTSVPTAEASE